MKYTFLGLGPDITGLPHPTPATKTIPDWYKDMPRARDPDTNEPTDRLVWADAKYGKLRSGMTLKQCIPLRDYLTSGYIIPLWGDIAASMRDNVPFFAWQYDDVTKMGWHPMKLMSPWAFKTPPGYSSFFFSPRYYKGLIEVLPAIVDTDTHHNVNFPFVYHGENNVDCVIERGTPVIQVVPFKRESWTMEMAEPAEGTIFPDKNFRGLLAEAYRKIAHRKKEFR
jgi:hypothetical protein